MSHMKDGEGHMCSICKNMEEGIRSDKFGRHFRVRVTRHNNWLDLDGEDGRSQSWFPNF